MARACAAAGSFHLPTHLTETPVENRTVAETPSIVNKVYRTRPRGYLRTHDAFIAFPNALPEESKLLGHFLCCCGRIASLLVLHAVSCVVAKTICPIPRGSPATDNSVSQFFFETFPVRAGGGALNQPFGLFTLLFITQVVVLLLAG
jgi:hypothetical protein